MKKFKCSLSLLMALLIAYSCVSIGVVTAAPISEQAKASSLLEFSTQAFRRPAPEVTLDATDVIRVGEFGDDTMNSGTAIKKSTPSGVPFITGTYASQAYAGEIPEWPIVIFSSSQAVNITSVIVDGGSASLTLASGKTDDTLYAKWEILSGTATAGSVMKITINYTYTWFNIYTGVDVTDNYSVSSYSYVENIIFPAGVWAFTAAYSNVNNAADVQYVSRVLGKGVYGNVIATQANSSNEYSAGYFNFSSNSPIHEGDTTIPKKAMLIADPPHKGAYDQYIADGQGTYTSGDSRRAKSTVYLDSSVQSLQSNNLRMHFFIHGSSRSTNDNRDLTYETIHVRDGDVGYTGATGNVLGTSNAGALAALNPTGPVDGTVATGGLYINEGMETQSTLYGTGTAGSYTLVTQWTGRGDKPPVITPNWMQYYHAVTVEIIRVSKSALRSALNNAIGTTLKTVTGSNAVTTIVSANGTDPENAAITNNGKGENPQGWYYSNGWSAYNDAYDNAWKNINQPSATQTLIDSAASSLTNAYNGLTLAGANYSDASSQFLADGLGNTLFGSSIASLNSLVNAVESSNSSFNGNLADWKEGTYDYYTPESRLALEQAYAGAAACQSTEYNVLYQSYVDYCAQQLQLAIEQLEYKQVTINFYGNGNTHGAMQPIYGLPGKIKTLTTNTFAKDGHSFLGWATTENGPLVFANEADITLGIEDVNLFAIWSINSYAITFDANGADGGWSEVLQYGEPLTEPTLMREGHLFIGWVPDVPPTVPGADTVYLAQWTTLSYTIEFDANGGTGGTINTLQFGSPLFPPDTEKTGYTFLGWSPFVPETVPSANTVYTAQWLPNSFLITFDANGGEGGSAQQLPFNSPLSAPVITREGYTLAGWSPPLPATVPAADTIYTAQWSMNTYTITFNANGGTGGTSASVNFGDVLTAPLVSRPGYSFNGWQPAVPVTAPAENVVYTAQWVPKKTQITFDANGGSGGVILDLDFESSLEAPIVDRIGYTFLGWSPWVPAIVPENNTIYVAQWSVNSYEFTFDANGGDGGSSFYVNFGELLVPPTVTKSGYVLSGWSPALPETAPAANITYTAQWTQSSFAVSFDLNGGLGTVPDGQLGSEGDEVNLPLQDDFSRQYYNFIGWSENAAAETPLISFINPGADTVLYAVWERVTVALTAKPAESTVIDSTYSLIYGIEPGTSADDFANDYVQMQGDGRLDIRFDNESFGTGTIVDLIDNVTGKVVSTYVIIIFGDVDGDGLVTESDKNLTAKVASYQTNYEQGSVYEYAADLNGDGVIDAFDLNMMKAVVRGIAVIDQANPAQLLF